MTVLASPIPLSRRRPRAIDILRTLYIYTTLLLGLLLLVLLTGPFLLVAACTLDPQRRTARHLAKYLFPNLVRHYCWLSRQPLQVDPAPFDWNSVGPCIVVANHCSSMDAVLLMALPRGIGDGRVWAKGWPFRIPFLGWLMRLSGHLLVEDFNILPDAQTCLADGSSLLVFPESSRSRTGKVARFREGAFLLAARTGFPIVPVAIHGSFACFPSGQPWIYGPPLRIQPLAVLHPNRADSKTHTHLRRQAHALITYALNHPTAA